MSLDITDTINNILSKNNAIPVRQANAVSGSIFVHENLNLVGLARETNIMNELMNGNIPNFLRNFRQVSVSDGTNSIEYLVMPDVLSIGQDSDYCRMSMMPHTAQMVADKYDCTLPTTKMVDDIWKQATNQLVPHALAPDADMSKTYRVAQHNSIITTQLTGLNPFALTSGHKKDIVLTNHLNPHNPNQRVAIYGWIRPNGTPIQPLNATSHAAFYEDYSHGARLIANDCFVNGTLMRMKDVFLHPVYSSLVSNEGPLTFTSY